MKKKQIEQKRFYNRDTNIAAFCLIYQMSIKHPYYVTQITNPFLN